MKNFNKKGFTMVELLIVLAIIAILAAVAIPVYSSQMENARKEVDNSNLRAATGLAAQDYILRTAGKAGTGNPEWSYVVFTFENSGTSNVKSQNMMVYPDNSTVYTDGSYDSTPPSKTVTPVPSGKNVAFKIDGWQYNNGHTVKVTKGGGSGKINDKNVVPISLQQNGGKGRFLIRIGPGGVVKESRILTNIDKITMS